MDTTKLAAAPVRRGVANSGLLRHRHRLGQSLIGLLVVIAIIAILTAVIYPKYMGRNEYSASGEVQGAPTAIDSANDAACTEYMSQVAMAANMYRQAHNSPPPDLKALKPYGVTDEMANTPNCNFGLPKDASQPQSAAPAQSAAPQVSWQQAPGAAPAQAQPQHVQTYSPISAAQSVAGQVPQPAGGGYGGGAGGE